MADVASAAVFGIQRSSMRMPPARQILDELPVSAGNIAPFCGIGGSPRTTEMKHNHVNSVMVDAKRG